MAKKFPSFNLDSLPVPAVMETVINNLKNGSSKVSMLGAGTGATIDVVSAQRDERGYLSEVADEYRPEIAERLGLAVNQVTEQHYLMAYDENPVLAQVKAVSKMSGMVRAANTAIASGVGVLAGLAASSLSRPTPNPDSNQKGKDPSNIAGGVAATFSALAAGKLTRKLTHTNHLDKKLEKTAHHQIMEIKEKQQRGEETTAADIFEVQLALKPELAEAVKQKAGKPFAKLEVQQQAQLMQSEFAEAYAANTAMADRINKDGVRPQQLMFGALRAEKQEVATGPGHPDLPPNAALSSEMKYVEASHAEEAGMAVLAACAAAAVGQQGQSQQQEMQPQAERDLVVPDSERALGTHDEKKDSEKSEEVSESEEKELSHVARYVGNNGKETQQDFVNRVSAGKETESPMQR